MRVRSVPVTCLAFVLATTGALTQARRAAETPARDEVVREVVRMLEADVDEALIERWLEHEERRPGPLSPDDLIALTRAEASRELIERLIGAGSPTSRSAHVGVIEPAGAPHATAGGGTTPLELSIRYRPYRDAEADEDEQWHLFVYLDGEPLAWSDGRGWLSTSKRNRELTHEVASGPHVLRLIEERHQRRGRRWLHEARVCPEPLELETDGRPRRVEVAIVEPQGLGFGGKSTFAWRVLDRDEVVTEAELTGPPQSWTPLCEEIEASWSTDEMPRRARRQLEGCARWADLWPGLDELPERAAVRAELERHRESDPD